jgi:hypothetical protein
VTERDAGHDAERHPEGEIAFEQRHQTFIVSIILE